MIAKHNSVNGDSLRLMLSHVQVQQDLKRICPERSSTLTAQQPPSLTGVKMESNKQVQCTTEKELITVTFHVCTSRVSMFACSYGVCVHMPVLACVRCNIIRVACIGCSIISKHACSSCNIISMAFSFCNIFSMHVMLGTQLACMYWVQYNHGACNVTSCCKWSAWQPGAVS